MPIANCTCHTCKVARKVVRCLLPSYEISKKRLAHYQIPDTNRFYCPLSRRVRRANKNAEKVSSSSSFARMGNGVCCQQRINSIAIDRSIRNGVIDACSGLLTHLRIFLAAFGCFHFGCKNRSREEITTLSKQYYFFNC